MKNLAATNRCNLFKEIAEEVWDHVIHNHSAGIEVSEIGVTNDIIANIRNKYNRIPNFGVWANPGYNEIIHGSDIDIFVETNVGNFVWYALQAKVLKLNGRYADMATIRGTNRQWDKLNELSKKTGCISRYLLYNGVAEYRHTGSDNCNSLFNEKQFGCSLVETKIIKQISLLRNPTFYDFHPEHAQPWRIIVCCVQNTKNNTLFNISQIKSAVGNYPVSFGNTSLLNQENVGQKLNELNVNAINEFSESVGRKPIYRIVIRNTASLKG